MILCSVNIMKILILRRNYSFHINYIGLEDDPTNFYDRIE